MAATGARSDHKARTREALVASARTLFRAQGYEVTTADHIAAGAGVSRRTFFRYFPSKDAVVFPHAESRLAAFRETLRPREGEAPLRALRRACLAMADEFAAHREELLLQQELMEGAPSLLARERELDRLWEEAVVDGLREAAGDREEAGRTHVVAGAVVGALRAVLVAWLAGGAPERPGEDLRTRAEEALELLASRWSDLSTPAHAGGAPQ